MTDSSSEADVPIPGPKAGMVAVVGRANVGKSSLINAMVGEKVSIVSPVAQTTRHRIRAIRNDPRGQMVLLDTPGIHRAPTDLGRLMNKAARHSAEGADVVLLVLDGNAVPRVEDEGWMRRLIGSPPVSGTMVAVNKSDTGAPFEAGYRDVWTRLSKERGVEPSFEGWGRISAETREGVDALLTELYRRLPEHPPLFPADVLTDFPRKLFIADVVREKLFLRLDQELPHRVAVRIDVIDETPEHGWVAHGSVFVERGSQVGIVIGYKGRMLRAVRRAAEAELLAVYDRPVQLDLRVDVQPNWTRNFFFLKQLGVDL